MIIQWISQLTTKRIIISLIIIAAGIYIIWYVMEALDGLDPNYQPYREPATSSTGNQNTVGDVFFDPNKKTSESKK